MIYSYNDLIKDIKFFSSCNLETGSIGKTICSRNLFYVAFKPRFQAEIHQSQTCNTKPPIIITGGIHAREHITCHFLIKLIKNFLEKGNRFSQKVYFIPMLNPDGIMLIKDGINSAAKKLQPLIEQVTKKSTGTNIENSQTAVSNRPNNPDLALFKANANCVDLNVNFDARWGSGKSNLTYPHTENYIGEHPFSENETAALRNFTLQKKPSMTLSYHAKGQELYWEFGQIGKRRKQDKALAKKINRHLKYRLIPDTKTSAGGYKDWCIEKLKIPSFTIEIVPDKYLHPLTNYNIIEKEFPLHIKMLEDILL
ncbi:MAG: hypothetical protein FWE22_00065 [Firmicutes bacterium]|nr:hypothetical protein [Bacillota bacterium]